MALTVQPAEDPTQAGCPCCSGEGGLRGFVYDVDEPVAVYFAEAGGMANKPVVLIGFAIGQWGSEAPKSERACVVFACSKGERETEALPTIPYMLAFPEFPSLGLGVEPTEASAHPLYPRMRETVMAIVAQDPRLAHLRSDGAGGASRFSAS